jgi:CBS domain containing-hemolysin-like protein
VTETQIFYIICLVVLLCLDLITKATQASMENATLARLLGQDDSTLPQIHRALKLLANPARLHASLELILLIWRFLIAGILVAMIAPWENRPNPDAAILIVLLLATLLLFLLEWIVAWGISRDAENWAIRLSGAGRLLVALASPVVAGLMRLAGEPRADQDSTVTETELIHMVEAGQQDGVLEQDEHKMIVSIIRLGDTLVREIMVPRIDMLALEVNTPIQQAADALLESGHSRVPVYQDTVDSVLGLLYAKDLLRVWREGNQINSLRDLLREAYFVPEAKKVDELLEELQARRIHIAIVVDEYGGVSGLVTLEDIVEEIVGEIRDEYDQSEELLFQAISEDEYVFHGRIDLDDFNDLMDTELSKSEADTLGGYIFSHVGHVPAAGDTIQIEHIQLTVEQISGQRIRKIRALRITPSTKNGVNDPHVDG